MSRSPAALRKSVSPIEFGAARAEILLRQRVACEIATSVVDGTKVSKLSCCQGIWNETGFLSMTDSDARGDERRKELFERVFQSPALFGRLFAAAELQNPVTGRYEHYLCRDLADGGDRILRQIHAEVFVEWLKFPPEEQENDIRLWLQWLGRTREESTDLLGRVEARATALIPEQYRRDPERALFLSGLRLVVGLIGSAW